MSGLINMISEYSNKLAIIPIICIIFAIISFIVYKINNKRIVKFIPSLATGIISLILLIISLSIFTTPKGLNLTFIAIFLGTGALFGIIVCFIIDLIVSIREDYLYINNDTEKNTSKTQKRVAKKINNKKKGA